MLVLVRKRDTSYGCCRLSVKEVSLSQPFKLFKQEKNLNPSWSKIFWQNTSWEDSPYCYKACNTNFENNTKYPFSEKKIFRFLANCSGPKKLIKTNFDNFKTLLQTWFHSCMIGMISEHTLCELTVFHRHMIDFEFNKDRQQVFEFLSMNVTSSYLSEKLPELFKNLHWVEKFTLALGIVFAIKKWNSVFLHMYRISCWMVPFFANKKDICELEKCEDILNIVDLSAQERAWTKWKFMFVTILKYSRQSKEHSCCLSGCFLHNLVCRADVDWLTYKAIKTRKNGNLSQKTVLRMHKTRTIEGRDHQKTLNRLLKPKIKPISLEHARCWFQRISHRWRSGENQHFTPW